MDGNRNQETGDLLQAFIAMSEKTMEKTHVCDVCRILSIDGTTAKVSLVNQKQVNTYAYIPTTDLRNDLAVGDIVLVIYTDYDTRANIKRLTLGQETKDVDLESTKHSINGAIIILKINI